jgi:hypothetical protein
MEKNQLESVSTIGIMQVRLLNQLKAKEDVPIVALGHLTAFILLSNNNPVPVTPRIFNQSNCFISS